ncbi:hypothetical protein EDD74_1516 [Faecalimonas umbilicata]|uniref:Uncharacterized protein n=1 Tax=Faecalimonas umbilicata TaxID=1912855 RepID=A0A4R3J3B6_9FIRM|nr:hypothetical protein [Faecalimonas umbilicata]TCS59787.1 hypothetical protein EDD74_1516 [Faecalimonas umbilicata]
MDTREVKRRRCPNGHPGSKEKKVSKWTPRGEEGVQMDTREVKRRRCPNGHPGSKEKKVSKWTPGK